MGERSRRYRKFVEEHPYCCFCGGGRATKTIDHVPGIGMFVGRQRPKGGESPACDFCQNATRVDEMIAAMAAHLAPGERSEEERRQCSDLIDAVNKVAPEVIAEMTPADTRTRRNIIKELALDKAAEEVGLTYFPSKLVAVHADGPRLDAAIRNFGRKLALATHYHQCGRIVPPDGKIAVRWLTNVAVARKEIPREFLSLLGPPGTLRQGRFNVGDQFVMRWTKSADGAMSAMLAFFRNSFVVSSLVQCEGETWPLRECEYFHPFKPPYEGAPESRS